MDDTSTIITRSFQIAGSVLLLYPCIPGTIMTIMERMSPRIRNQQHLDDVVGEEAPKLGFDPSDILIYLKAHPLAMDTSCCVLNKGKPELWINPENGTVATVRHEIYHLYRDKGKKHSPLKYFFVSEMRAKAYASFGWKL